MGCSNNRKFLAGTKTLIFSIAIWIAAAPSLRADGCFVFKWNKSVDINEPTQKAIIVHDAGQEDLILQVKYQGPLNEFGWLVPVPALPKVERASMDCFYELSELTQRRFGGGTYTKGEATLGLSNRGGEPEKIKVIEIKTVGDYEIAVLSAKEAGALEQWLQKNDFTFPKNKSDILESYIKHQWYFVAIRVALDKRTGNVTNASPKGTDAGKRALENKLAAGELHPLHISFASEDCVFPLKISAVNGKPSEVSLYVIATDPLVNRELFEKTRVANRATWEKEHAGHDERRDEAMKNLEALRMGAMLFERGRPTTTQPHLSPEELRALAARLQGPELKVPGEEPFSERAMRISLFSNYMPLEQKQISKCIKEIPRLKGRSWFLTKTVETFAPEKMKDLKFEPVLPILSALLREKEGVSAAEQLRSLGKPGEDRLLKALQSTNVMERLSASEVLQQWYPQISRDFLLKLLHDPERDVRANAVYLAGHNWDSGLADLLIDSFAKEDVYVRGAIASELRRHTEDIERRRSVFIKLLKSPEPLMQAAALHVMSYFRNVEVPRENLLPLLNSPYMEISGGAIPMLTPLSSDELTPLLKNSTGMARLRALKLLEANADVRAIELIMTRLNDPEEPLRKRAGSILQRLTGQDIPYDQPQRWQEWWKANAQTFVPVKTPATNRRGL